MPIANYMNDAAGAGVGARLHRILDSHGIDSVSACTVGCTLNVMASEEHRARKIVAQAILDEGLAVELVRMVPEGGRAETISVEEALRDTR